MALFAHFFPLGRADRVTLFSSGHVLMWWRVFVCDQGRAGVNLCFSVGRAEVMTLFSSVGQEVTSGGGDPGDPTIRHR